MTKKKKEPITEQQQELMERFVVEANENTMLRAHSRHSMRLGNIELDIIPMDKTQSLEDIMKQFAKFAKLMKDLHGNSHLTTDDGQPKVGNMAGMFE